MVRVPITSAASLEDLYNQLRAGQEAAHGSDYCSHHSVIRKLATSCRSYCELGVNQGATLACAILAGFEHVVGVDIALGNLEPFTGLFEGKATLLEQDHLAPLPFAVDFLLLDALHTAKGLKAELEAHGDMVRRHLLIHDTAAHPELHVTACVYAAARDWTVHSRETRGYGWTLLSRNP